MQKNIAELFSLSGRTAIVTGGTSGIGLMLARGLLMAGANVYIVGRNAQTCATKARELSVFGDCKFIVADLAAPAGVALLVEEINARASDISILLNNAGMTGHAAFGDYSENLWDEVFTLNAKAPFLLTQALLPLLKNNASAGRPTHIINTGSIAALVSSTPDSWAYGPSKAALHQLTRTLAKKFTADHIRVNAIAPGLFPTRMSEWITSDPAINDASLQQIPAGRYGEPDDIAALVVYIASSRYLTGTVTVLDGGLSL